MSAGPIALALFGFSLGSAPMGTCAVQPEAAWKRIEEGQGLALYEAKMPGSEVLAFKAEAVIDAPVARLVGVLLDYRHSREWIGHLEEDQVLRRVSPLEYVDYSHIGTPFVMKDRDIVIDVRTRIDNATRKVVIATHSIEDPAAPKTGYVRAEVINNRYTMMPEGDGTKTRMIAEIHVDPRGSVAKWLVNLFQRSFPRDTFTAIQRRMRGPLPEPPPEVKAVMRMIRF